MADPRWTAETEELVASKGAGSHAARDILEALAEAGVLMPPGGQTEQRYRHQFTNTGGSIELTTREGAERWHQRYCVEDRGPLDAPHGPCVTDTAVLTRWPDGTQLIGRWIEVPTDA